MYSEKILIVNNDTNTQNGYKALLKPCGYDISFIEADKNIFNILDETDFNLVLIDIAAWRDEADIRLSKKIKERFPNITIFILRTDSSPKTIKNVFEIGVEDCFIKPFLPICLVNAINRTFHRIRLSNENNSIKQDLINTQEKYKALKNDTAKLFETKNIFKTDNFPKLFEYEVKRAKRHEHWLSLLLCKYQNKKALKEVDFCVDLNNAIKKIIRESDIITAYDNGFAIILPEASDDGCNQLSQRLRENINPKYEIKLGSSSYPIDSHNIERLIKLANSRLQ